MPLNPLAPVSDYQSMLNRIFWFTSAAGLGAIWLLRRHVPELEATLQQLDFAVAWNGEKPLPTPAGYLLPALAIGMAARVFRLHARVSDWLRISERFDVQVIIGEFAHQTGIDLETVGDDQLRRARAGIMRKAFYPFVSGSPSAPTQQIDQQLVQQALDAWSWFWIGLVATLLYAAAGCGLIACGAVGIGIQTLGGTIIFAALALPAMYGQCRRYAVAQVRAILADATRAAVVRGALADVTGMTIYRQMAA